MCYFRRSINFVGVENKRSEAWESGREWAHKEWRGYEVYGVEAERFQILQ